MDLNELRVKIDDCDREIVKLLEDRFDYVAGVAEYKLKNNMEIFDTARELAVLDKAGGFVKNKKYAPYIKDIYTGMMDASKNLQKELINENKTDSDIITNKPENTRVVYQGVPGSYSEEAMLAYFGDKIKPSALRTFDQVAEAVIRGEADYGILPTENSSTGSVNAVMDLLVKGGLYISGEYVLPVCQNLVAKKGTNLSDIKEVYSHEQGFLQCTGFLKNHPDWKQTEYVNTAISAKMVAESYDTGKAAISSRRAAEIYGLDILAEEINGSKTNSTRFTIFSNKPENNPLANKISIMFSLPHRSGTLFEALKLINNQGLNLLKIESRPILKVNWEYMFFIDFEGNINEERCTEAIANLKSLTGTFRLLGNYVKDSKVV